MPSKRLKQKRKAIQILHTVVGDFGPNVHRKTALHAWLRDWNKGGASELRTLSSTLSLRHSTLFSSASSLSLLPIHGLLLREMIYACPIELGGDCAPFSRQL